MVADHAGGGIEAHGIELHQCTRDGLGEDRALRLALRMGAEMARRVPSGR